KILKADSESVSKIEGIGRKTIDNIQNSLRESLSKASLGEIMGASLLFGVGMGVKKMEEIVKIYPDILSHEWDSEEFYQKLKIVPGFQEISIKKVIEGWKDFVQFMNELKS